MQETECITLPVALRRHEYCNGLWLNEDKTFLSVARLEDFPGVVPAEIKTMLNKGIHRVESLSGPGLIQDDEGMPLFIYRAENLILQTSSFEKHFVDAALQAPNPKMYLYSENGPLLVEHDEGFYLIACVKLDIKKEISFVDIGR